MSEENKKRTVRATFDRKFGVSERRDERRFQGEKKEGSSKDFRGRRERAERAANSREDFPRRERNDRFNRDRRPREGRSFGDRRKRYDAPRRLTPEEKAPIFRQRPEQKEINFEEEVVSETTLETRAAEATTQEVATPFWLRKLIALTTERGREKEGQFLGEGVHVVEELVKFHRDLVIDIFVVAGFEDERLVDLISDAGIKISVLTPEEMKQISTTVTPQGIIAHCQIASKKPVYDSSRSVLTLVDAVQDPGNLGTLFRTSLGFSSSGMVLGRGTVSPFNPKVVRGSSGTFLRVPFEFDVDLIEHINMLRSKGYAIIATDLHARQSLKDIPPHKLRKMAFLVGNEGAGTNPHFIALADETVKIPMSSELESLNVSVAHGILSYEAAQIQESLKKGPAKEEPLES